MGEKVESPSHGGEPGLSGSMGEPVAREGRPRHRLISKSAHVHFNCTKRSPAEGPGSLCGSAWLGDAWGGMRRPQRVNTYPILRFPKLRLEAQPGWKPQPSDAAILVRPGAPYLQMRA